MMALQCIEWMGVEQKLAQIRLSLNHMQTASKQLSINFSLRMGFIISYKITNWLAHD